MKLHLTVAGLLILMLAWLPIPAGAADFDAPIESHLVLAPPTASGGGLIAQWSGVPQVTPGGAELTIVLAREGGTQKIVLKRALTLAAGRNTAVSGSFSPPAPGTYTLISFLKMRMIGGQYTKSDSVRFSIGANRALKIETEPVLTAGQFAAQFRPPLPRGKTAAKPAAAPNLAGFNVRGTLDFTNIRFESSHTTQTIETRLTTETMPLRGVKVQVCDLISSYSFFYYQVLGTVYPDVNGNFLFNLPSNDDGDGTGRDIFLHVVSDSGYARVQDFNSTVYSLDLFPDRVGIRRGAYCTFDWQGGAMDLGTIVLPLAQSGPYNIIDAVRQGFTLVQRWGLTPPKAVVRWAWGNSEGAFISFSTQLITLRGGAANCDQFDDGVILHEYGHLVAMRLSKDKSPGGTHYFDQPADRALAWSEGWATFFSCAARGTRFLVDLVGTQTPDYLFLWPGMSMDLETFSDIFSFDYRRGDDVEACVAGALWDVYDFQNEYRDTLSDSLIHIWPIFTAYFNSSRACTFRDFYDGWVAYGYPGQLQLRAILEVFGISYWNTLMVNSMLIEKGAEMTGSRTVALNNLAAGNPTQYMASESSAFDGAKWLPYSAAPSFTLSPGNGVKLVFFRVRNALGEVSTPKFDRIDLKEQIPLVMNALPLKGMVPDPGGFDWYRLKIAKAGRHLIEVIPSTTGSVLVEVFKAGDLTKPVFVGTALTPSINEIFAAGDFVVIVMGQSPTPVGVIPVDWSGLGWTYTIRALPYTWVLQ